MARCKLSIRLDHPERRYVAGDRITGYVDVVVDVATKCNGLSVTRLWQTHGRGNHASGGSQSAVIHRGEWQPGSYSYPFSLLCPHESPSYRGELLDVDWSIEARADLPWAIDPKAATDVHVELRPDASVELEPKVRERERLPVLASSFAIAFVVIGLLTLVGALVELEPLVLKFALLWNGLVAVVVWQLVERRVARRAFRHLDIALERPSEGRLAAAISFRTRRTINAITASFVVEEQVVSGTGTERKIHTHELHAVARRLDGAEAGSHVRRVEFELPDPRELGWSFATSDNALRWYVAVDFDVAGWPDLREELELAVRPKLPTADGPYR
jgi:hypothetical protein